MSSIAPGRLASVCQVAAVAAAVASVLVAVPTAADATVLLRSDSSWNVTPNGPSAGWNTSTGFDDSAWQNATELYNVGLINGNPNNLGTMGIWSSGGQFSTTETQAWFRQTISLGELSAASLVVGCDDDCTVYVNGVMVIQDTNGSANDNTVSDLLPYLVVGLNLFAYTTTDNYRVWGYNHSTWLQLDGEARSTTVPEPGTIAMIGLGLAGLAALRRRRT